MDWNDNGSSPNFLTPHATRNNLLSKLCCVHKFSTHKLRNLKQSTMSLTRLKKLIFWLYKTIYIHVGFLNTCFSYRSFVLLFELNLLWIILIHSTKHNTLTRENLRKINLDLISTNSFSFSFVKKLNIVDGSRLYWFQCSMSTFVEPNL